MAAFFVACVGGAYLAGREDAPSAQPASTSKIEVHAGASVITAIRDMAKLEATSFHIEKVIEVNDEQQHLWGLVQAKDALLLVAVGDVTAGVDLSQLQDGDVTVDAATHTVHVRLPAPEITSSALDEKATHVYQRSTDVMAERNEQLESDARRAAEEQMRQAALAAGILDRARTSADRTLRALLRSLGWEQVEITWADKRSPGTPSAVPESSR